MKSAIFAAVALAVPAVYAQVTGLPDCATPCLLKELPQSKCSESDYKCLCSDMTYLEAVGACFKSSCSADQLTSAFTAAHAFCQMQGVTITDLPQGGPRSTTTTPPAPPETKTHMMPTIPVVTTPTEVPTPATTYPPTTDVTTPYPPTTDVTTPYPPTTDVTTLYPPTSNLTIPYPPTTDVTTPTSYPPTTYPGTTTTIYGTGSSITVSRNITSPTVIPPPSNSGSAAVKNVAGLGAMAMIVAGFFAL